MMSLVTHCTLTKCLSGAVLGHDESRYSLPPCTRIFFHDIAFSDALEGTLTTLKEVVLKNLWFPLLIGVG